MKYILLFALVFMVGIASAFTDHVARMEDNGGYGTIAVKDMYGAGSTIAEHTLTKNSDLCFNLCYAEGQTTLNDAGALFDDITFKDEDGLDNLLNYSIYIKQDENYIPYNVGDTLEAGTYEWRIEAIKNATKSIDWVVTSNDVELTEWAWWVGVAPQVYYNFDQTTTSGYLIDQAGHNNLTIRTGVTFVNGKVGKAGNTGTLAQGFNTSIGTTNYTLGSGDFTVAVWINKSSSNSDAGLISAGGDNYVGAWQLRLNSNNTLCFLENVVCRITTPTAINDALWHRYIFSRIGTTLYLYRDGTEVSRTNSFTTAMTKANNDFWIGYGGGGAVHEYDELAIFSGYGFTASDATFDYNSGSGLPLNTTSSVFTEVSQQYNTNVIEGSTQTFSINYTNSSFVVNYAKLFYNNTLYTGNRIDGFANVSITVPSIVTPTNKTFYWTFSITNSTGTFIVNSTLKNQTINPSNFTICGASPQNTTFFNITFKDEVTGAYINGSISNAVFMYGDSSLANNRSYTYSATNYPSYAYCYSPDSNNITAVLSVSYLGNSTYPQRSIYNSYALSSSVTNKVLYLLDLYNGNYVTFQVINSAQQPLSGVAVNITKVIGGSNEIVSSGVTGSDGSVTFWLNPNSVYTANFRFGSVGYSVTQALTQTSYTVSMNTNNNVNVSDYTKGITYSLKPQVSYLLNGTTYPFNFTISSTYWALSSYGFTVYNQDNYSLGTFTGSSSNGGVVTGNIFTGSNESLYVLYYYVINGSLTQAGRPYLIIDTSQNTYSIYNLITDFKTYKDIGIYGLSDFGVGLLCFIVILGLTGFVKSKYGVSDESVLFGIVFSLVALFDVSFNLLPNPIGAISHFPTVLMGLIFAGLMFKELQ